MRTLSKLIDRLDQSIHGDLSGAFHNQLSPIREQTEAVEAEAQEIEARIKEQEARIEELERVRGYSLETQASSTNHRSLKQIVGRWRRQRVKRRNGIAVGLQPVIAVYDHRGDFSGFLSPLGIAKPSAPDSVSEGAKPSPSLTKQQARKENT